MITNAGVDPFGRVSSIFKDDFGYYCSKTRHNYLYAHASMIVARGFRNANVTAVPRSASSPDTETYRPISITQILSKVYDKLVSHKLSSFCEKSAFSPAALFAYICIYRKCLGFTDTLLTISDHLQKSLDARMESYVVELDFSAAFNKVSHSGLLFKLISVGGSGSVLYI